MRVSVWSWCVFVAVSITVVVSGCSVRGGGAPRGPTARTMTSPKPPPPRPEGFDEVRQLAPAERVEVDPQAAFMLRDSTLSPLALSDSSTPTGLTTVALLDTARAETRGFAPDGGLREVTLQQGQRASAGFDLAAGECLTVIAHGGLGVREVDAFIMLGDTTSADIFAQDGSGGPLAIVGGLAGCTRTLVARHVEVVVLVRKGQGSVVTAVYRSRAP